MRTTHLCGVWVSRKKEINCTFSFCIFSTSEKSINIFDIKIKWLKPSAAFSNLMFNEINRILQTVSSVQCPSLTVLHAIMFIRLFFSCKDPSISIHYICSTKLHRSTYVVYQHGSNSLLLLGRCKHSCWCLSQQEWFVQTKEKLRLKKNLRRSENTDRNKIIHQDYLLFPAYCLHIWSFFLSRYTLRV